MILKTVLFLFPMIAVNTADYTCYGNVTKLNPTGMHHGGVPASNRAIDSDAEYFLRANRSCYIETAVKHCIQPAVIAAVASRESRGGLELIKTDGWGDHHHAWGIMQCDIRYHKDCRKFWWDSCSHIDQMVSEVLVPYVKAVEKKFPKWTAAQQLQGGIAAYNFGVNNVRSWKNLDKGTTGNDYSNDVVARAQRLISAHGWK